MSMPPYLRFAENESIQNKIWSLRPRNPFCGLVSLETGSKIFAWANIVSNEAPKCHFLLGHFAITHKSSYSTILEHRFTLPWVHSPV